MRQTHSNCNYSFIKNLNSAYLDWFGFAFLNIVINILSTGSDVD